MGRVRVYLNPDTDYRMAQIAEAMRCSKAIVVKDLALAYLEQFKANDIFTEVESAILEKLFRCPGWAINLCIELSKDNIFSLAGMFDTLDAKLELSFGGKKVRFLSGPLFCSYEYPWPSLSSKELLKILKTCLGRLIEERGDLLEKDYGICIS